MGGDGMKRWVPVIIAVILEIVLAAIVLGAGLTNEALLEALWILLGVNLLLVILPLTVRLLRPAAGPAEAPRERESRPATPFSFSGEKDLLQIFKTGARMLSSDLISKEDHKAACRMIIYAARNGCKEAVDYLNQLPPEKMRQIQP
jgi:hypothetical protein